MKKSRPWSAYLLRLVCCALLFGSAYSLLSQSTFTLRMRNDFPVGTLVLAVSAAVAFLPILFGKRYLGALVASAILVSAIGGYWWTTIPWDELVKDSGFPATTRPQLLDYVMVAAPAIVVAFYAIASRPSTLHTDLTNRGADPDEIRSAAATSFLAGAALLVVCGALAFALWWLMAGGAMFAAMGRVPVGIPALVLVAALGTVAYAIFAGRLPRPALRKPRAPVAAAPSGEGRAAKKRSVLARLARRKAPG
ncbi:MAG TPA: hypothetical protein VM370_00615 [Candidatus Thermoplasmatota archaeon]|nr:hypothetical protein [Candidatus Thermoplasmatota archaeon]